MKNKSEGLSSDDIELIAAFLAIIVDALGLWALIKAKQEKS